MKFFLNLLFFSAFLTLFLNFFSLNVRAQSVDCSDTSKYKDFNPSQIENCQNAINNALGLLNKALAPNEAQLKSLQNQIQGIKERVKVIDADVAIKKQDIDKGYKNLEQKKKVFDITVAHQYIESYYDNWLTHFLSSSLATDFIQNIAYQKAKANQDKVIITNIVLSVTDLETKKQNLESEQARLITIKTNLDDQSAKLDKIVSGAKAYQATLSNQLAALSARQKEILGQRLSSLNLPQSLGAGPLVCTDDRKLDPGFSQGFAFFTFGIPHRVGMNQYGAWGRAKNGESADQILQAYFQNFEFQGGKENETVIVNGTNEFNQTFNNESMNIEDYMKHLHEMPTSWTDNDSAALKAQAIAARSYALRVYSDKNSDNDPNNNFLRPSQADQVIKRELNDERWISAVDTTKGKVMMSEGKPIKAWFASTSGGYTFTSQDVWGGSTSWTKRLRDTNGDVNSFSDLISKSYDKDSKCLYAAQGWRNQYGKSAWLKQEEVADIANTLLLTKADSSTGEHLYQVDKPNPAGTDNWDANRVKDELKKRNITPYNSVSSIPTPNADFGNGITASISITGDSRSDSFDGGEFKDRFNLRAPANIQIVGPLFNIEKK